MKAPPSPPPATPPPSSPIPDAIAAGQPLPCRVASPPDARLAHLLAEPWRRRPRPGYRLHPPPRRHRQPHCLARAAARGRGAGHDLRLYRGTSSFPSPSPPSPAPLHLQAHASWLVCSTLCVPEESDFTLDLPSGQPAPSAGGAALRRRRRPHAGRLPPYTARIAPDGTLSLTGDGLPASVVRAATFFPTAAGCNRQWRGATPGHAGGRAHPRIASRHIVSTRRRSWPGCWCCGMRRAARPILDIVATPGPAPAAGPSIARMLLLALAGGLILNLMPCVFPVLAMKAGRACPSVRGGTGVPSGAMRRPIRRGVVLAFLALGGGLLALRAAGQAARVGVPVPVADLRGGHGVAAVRGGAEPVRRVRHGAVGWPGRDSRWPEKGGHTGSFFTGVVGGSGRHTPVRRRSWGRPLPARWPPPRPSRCWCSPRWGLAWRCRYTLFAFAPGLARMLPRPGVWMDVLKQVLAFPMYGAGAWLVWVISQEAGSDGVLATASGMVALGFAAWALGWAQRGWPAAAAGARGGAGGCRGGGLRSRRVCRTASGPAAQAERGQRALQPPPAWRPSGRQGGPCFVNMTAAWCVSLSGERRIALAPQCRAGRFDPAPCRVFLMGDWTRQDPVITTFLRGPRPRRRSALRVLQAGAGPAVLPQILTENACWSRSTAPGG